MLSHLLIRMKSRLAVEWKERPLEVLVRKTWASVSELTTVVFLLVESAEKLYVAIKRKKL